MTFVRILTFQQLGRFEYTSYGVFAVFSTRLISKSLGYTMHMADSMKDLLAGRAVREPHEVQVIKTYVYAHFQQTPTVALQTREIIIGVKSAALAGALRPHLLPLKEACETDKRLVIRIQH